MGDPVDLAASGLEEHGGAHPLVDVPQGSLRVSVQGPGPGGLPGQVHLDRGPQLPLAQLGQDRFPEAGDVHGGGPRVMRGSFLACLRGLSVGFTTAAALVHELMEARDERRLLNLQRQLSRLNLLIIDELGFVPLSPTGAELLFEVLSQRYERGSILVTANLPFDEWTEVFGSERLTGALLDRLTHHVHILEMNGDSYRLKRSRENTISKSLDQSDDT